MHCDNVALLALFNRGYITLMPTESRVTIQPTNPWLLSVFAIFFYTYKDLQQGGAGVVWPSPAHNKFAQIRQPHPS